MRLACGQHERDVLESHQYILLVNQQETFDNISHLVVGHLAADQDVTVTDCRIVSI